MIAKLKRREFITLLGGAAAAWPVVARAQQTERVRRIGFLTPNAESDPESQTWIKELTQRLTELGWTSGGNIRIDYRFGNADVPLLTKAANELIELRPDVVLAVGTPAAAAFGSGLSPYRSCLCRLPILISTSQFWVTPSKAKLPSAV